MKAEWWEGGTVMLKKVALVNRICLLLLAVLMLVGTNSEAGQLEDIAARGTIRIGTTGDKNRVCADQLAAPLKDKPFTRHSCGILMQKGDQEWLNYINFVLAELKMDGTLANLEEKYLK